MTSFTEEPGAVAPHDPPPESRDSELLLEWLSRCGRVGRRGPGAGSPDGRCLQPVVLRSLHPGNRPECALHPGTTRHDPEEAIVRAVNDTVDNDTVGAIVGAAVGALHGRDALPRRWVEGLVGRTTDDDDGRVFELLQEARARWYEHPFRA